MERSANFYPRFSWLAACAVISFASVAGSLHATPRKQKAVDTTPPVTKPAVEKAPTTVPRVAPDFSWEGPGGKAYPLKKLRGQPVVLLIAASPEAGDLRKQAKRIQDLYLQFSAKKTVFIAAFTAQTGRVPASVPFVIAQNGAGVQAAYGVTGTGLAVVVIGPDGNVDLKTTGVQGAQLILDIINNNYQGQAAQRAGQGG
jgi:hypothetical protein